MISKDWFNSVGLDDLSSCDYWLVVSQSCDLISPNLDNEPNIELLGACEVSTIDGELINLNNPRRLQQTKKKDGKDLFLEFQTSKREFTSRQICIDHPVPSTYIPLSKTQLDEIITLLTSRYSRAAFPNKLEDLIATKKRNIKTLLKRSENVEALEAIYFRHQPDGDINENEEYSVDIMGLIDNACHTDKQEKAIDTFEKYCDLLRLIPEIKVRVSQTFKTDELTVAQVRMFKKFNYDYFSYRDNGE